MVCKKALNCISADNPHMPPNVNICQDTAVGEDEYFMMLQGNLQTSGASV